MSNSLNQCKLRHGWIKPFLAQIKNGLSEKNAANAAGEGTNAIHRLMDKDPVFKADYDAARAQAASRPRGTHGAF